MRPSSPNPSKSKKSSTSRQAKQQPTISPPRSKKASSSKTKSIPTKNHSDPPWETESVSTLPSVQSAQEITIELPYVAPRYKAGTGPPSVSATLIPPHDSTAYIIGRMFLPEPLAADGKPRPKSLAWLIGFTDQPAARIAVRAHRILDYVSPREFENYEYRQWLKREEEREAIEKGEMEDPREKEKRRAAELGLGKRSRQPGRPDKEFRMVLEAQGRPLVAPFQNLDIATPDVETEDDVAPSVDLPVSIVAPSLSSPGKKRKLQVLETVDTGTDEDQPSDTISTTPIQTSRSGPSSKKRMVKGKATPQLSPVRMSVADFLKKRSEGLHQDHKVAKEVPLEPPSKIETKPVPVIAQKPETKVPPPLPLGMPPQKKVGTKVTPAVKASKPIQNSSSEMSSPITKSFTAVNKQSLSDISASSSSRPTSATPIPYPRVIPTVPPTVTPEEMWILRL